MPGWIFDSGLSAGWPGQAGLHVQDELHHPQTYLLTDDGQLSIVSEAKGGGGHGPPGSGGGGGTSSPTFTLVGPVGGLQIDLLWDTSVQTAVNWSDIEHTVVAAAQIFTANFTTHAVLNNQVCLVEENGTAIDRAALGESETQG